MKKKTPKKTMPTITLSDLYRKFGRRAELVLSDYLSLQPRKKGEQRSFQILAPLPNGETYTRMEAATFRKPLADQVKEAYVEFGQIRDSLEEWYKGMPKGFQIADHGKQIKKCIERMEHLCDHEPPVPKDVRDVQVVFVPEAEESLDGRPEKRDNAVKRLKACLSVLEEEDAENKFVEVLKDSIKSASAIKFPSMFS